MNITLVGYRGTGKSSVGPLLAARLGWTFVDADTEIVARAGRSIPDIFKTDGEATFRELEVTTLDDLLRKKNCVIATGGGAILSDITRQGIRESGPVVWLTAAVNTILARIESDIAPGGNRPSLTDLDPRVEIETVLAQRKALYSDVATITIATDIQSPTHIVDEILRQLPMLARQSEDES